MALGELSRRRLRAIIFRETVARHSSARLVRPREIPGTSGDTLSREGFPRCTGNVEEPEKPRRFLARAFLEFLTNFRRKTFAAGSRRILGNLRVPRVIFPITHSSPQDTNSTEVNGDRIVRCTAKCPRLLLAEKSLR